jgi:hypothetical protein
MNLTGSPIMDEYVEEREMADSLAHMERAMAGRTLP